MSDSLINSALTTAEAERRRAVGGPNSMPGETRRSLLAIARGVLLEPMFILLIGAAAIYFALGDVREALVLAASLLVIIAMTVAQERRTDAALQKLKDLSSPRALVIRDGVEQRIAGQDVVMDDVILLREGDRVPADGTLLEATELLIDESILNGESQPAEKQASVAESEASHVFSSTLIVHGHGAAKVTATGARTQVGKIGVALQTLEPESPPLVRQIRSVVRYVAIFAFAVCIAIAVLYAAKHDDWLSGVLVGITMAMGILPEEFPVVLTVFLAMGAWRISKSGVLTRRMPAIETMGATTVLAVDKTGTLTENHMRVATLTRLEDEQDLRLRSPVLSEATRTLLSTAYAASELTPADPMERAIAEAGAKFADTEVDRFHSLRLVHEYELTPQLLVVTHVWSTNHHGRYLVASKGAPEAVFALCELDDQSRAEWLAKAASHAKRGLRVLAVARGEFEGTEFPDSPAAFRLRLIGLLTLIDPLRSNVPAAVEQCARAGIRVIMITGDHPDTAVAIARDAGIDVSGGVMLGQDLETPGINLGECIKRCNVFARTSPSQKLQLVKALQAAGEIVGMTGDGVNDALALKAAHIGVAMGARGTDVAREAASLVLLNDEFASLVDAIRLGRRVYENLRHAIQYLLAVHIPIAGMGLLPVLLGWPIVFYPLHVLFLEFVIDPASCLVFEGDAEDERVMRRPPRDPRERLITASGVLRSLSLGVGALAITVAIYAIALQAFSTTQARALAFASIVCGNLMLIHLHRAHRSGSESKSINWPFWWISGGALATLALVIHSPFLSRLFQFSAPPLWSLLVLLIATALITSTLEKYLVPRMWHAADDPTNRSRRRSSRCGLGTEEDDR